MSQQLSPLWPAATSNGEQSRNMSWSHLRDMWRMSRRQRSCREIPLFSLSTENRIAQQKKAPSLLTRGGSVDQRQSIAVQTSKSIPLRPLHPFMRARLIRPEPQIARGRIAPARRRGTNCRRLANQLLDTQLIPTFFDQVKFIGLDIVEDLNLATWPPNLDSFSASSIAQTEMQTKIALRNVASTAAHLLHLLVALGMHGDPRTDRVAIGFCPT